MDKERLLCVGEISSPHGVRGEVKIKSFTADPAALGSYNPLCSKDGTVEYALRVRSVVNNFLIAGIKGVTTREAAQKLRGTKLFVPRAKLPKAGKGHFYVEDLKGISAVDEKGEKIALVKDVLNFGAGDLLVIENEAGREWILPFKAPYAGKPDMDKGQVKVAIPEGYPFSENKKKTKPSKRK
jgi:16S rRNA processing protein RimM